MENSCKGEIIDDYFITIGAVAGRGSYTERIWPLHIVDLNCTGTERTIWECPHNDLYNVYTCGSINDASVICQGLCLFDLFINACRTAIIIYHCSKRCAFCQLL